MPRRTKEELLAEYDKKLELFKVLWQWEKQFMDAPVPDDADPVKLAIKWRGATPISAHLSGLQQAINDMLEMARDSSPEERAQLSDMLQKANQPSLSELDEKLEKQFRRILERKSIKNEEEYYLITERLSNLDSGLTTKEIKALDKMVFDFESLQ